MTSSFVPNSYTEMLNHDDEEQWKNVGDEEIVSTFLFAHGLKILQKYYISRCVSKPKVNIIKSEFRFLLPVVLS